MGAEYAILGTGIGGDRRAEVMVALFYYATDFCEDFQKF